VCHVEPDVPIRVEVDGDRLRQVLTNLVGNAVKFTDRGEVVIHAGATRLDSENTLLQLEVIDTGIGIDDAEQAKLFEAFSQLDGSSTRRFGGTGLGLAISKKFVGLMGGELGVTSKKGRGSRFFVRLPVRVVGGADDAHPECESQHARARGRRQRHQPHALGRAARDLWPARDLLRRRPLRPASAVRDDAARIHSAS